MLFKQLSVLMLMNIFYFSVSFFYDFLKKTFAHCVNHEHIAHY